MKTSRAIISSLIALTFAAIPALTHAQAPVPDALFDPPAPISQTPASGPQTQSTQPAMPTNLPPGVEHIYAVQGDNSLIVLADQDGFNHVRDLVRNLSGDLDIIHTHIDAVDLSADDEKALGVKIDTTDPAPGPQLEATLIGAWKHDKLHESCYPLRVVTRENTSVDVMLESHKHRVKTRLSYVPRVAKDGRMVVELMEPVSVMAAAPSGDTLVVIMPGKSTDSARILFITTTEGR